MANKVDLSSLPVIITLENTGSKEVGFRYFRVNFTEVLPAGDSVVIAAQSSEEAAYYLALANSKIGLSVTQATSSQS